MIDDGSLHDVVRCWSVLVLVNSQYATRFDSDDPHPQLASSHRFKLRTEIHGLQQFHRNALVLGWRGGLRRPAWQSDSSGDCDNNACDRHLLPPIHCVAPFIRQALAEEHPRTWTSLPRSCPQVVGPCTLARLVCHVKGETSRLSGQGIDKKVKSEPGDAPQVIHGEDGDRPAVGRSFRMHVRLLPTRLLMTRLDAVPFTADSGSPAVDNTFRIVG
jgi:hypothetical protein